LNWDEYVEKAQKTITYDSREKALFCTMAGMHGELVEYIEHTHAGSESSLILGELGDICWYTGIMAKLLDISLEVTTKPFLSTICPGDIPNLIDNGSTILGKLSEVLKKVARDDAWELTDLVKREKATVYLNSYYTLLREECADKGFNFSDVLSFNIEKLYDRMDRGVLKGSGDKR